MSTKYDWRPPRQAWSNFAAHGKPQFKNIEPKSTDQVLTELFDDSASDYEKRLPKEP